MRQLFKIDESEKKRILEMHERATKKNYLMEQGTPGSPTPQTTPPPAQPQNTTGGEIEGTETIDRIKDDKSLNRFMNWGYDAKSPEAEINPDVSRVMTLNMAYRLNFKKVTNNEDMREKEGTTEGKRAAEAIRKVYEDFKYIAQNYTLTELCSDLKPTKGNLGYLPEVTPIQVLAMAQNRAKDLGWCPTKTQNKPSKSDIKQKINNPEQFKSDRSKA